MIVTDEEPRGHPAPPVRKPPLTPRNRWRLIGLVVAVLGAYLYAMPEFAWHRLAMLVVLAVGGLGNYASHWFVRDQFRALFGFGVFFILYIDVTQLSAWQPSARVIGGCVLVLASTGLLLETTLARAREQPRLR
jgi:hypothetical protein